MFKVRLVIFLPRFPLIPMIVPRRYLWNSLHFRWIFLWQQTLTPKTRLSRQTLDNRLGRRGIFAASPCHCLLFVHFLICIHHKNIETYIFHMHAQRHIFNNYTCLQLYIYIYTLLLFLYIIYISIDGYIFYILYTYIYMYINITHFP